MFIQSNCQITFIQVREASAKLVLVLLMRCDAMRLRLRLRCDCADDGPLESTTSPKTLATGWTERTWIDGFFLRSRLAPVYGVY